jgi:hypothetical protein
VRFAATILALLALAGCKKYSVESELIVQPYVMVTSGSDVHTPGHLVRVYVFYTDQKEYLEPQWRPGSYADAEAGILRHLSSGEERSHSLVGTQSEGDGFVHITLTRSPMTLVAVDPVNKFYAWRTFKYEVPLERLYVPVSFKIYQPQPYKEMEWRVASERGENIPQDEI